MIPMSENRSSVRLRAAILQVLVVVGGLLVISGCAGHRTTGISVSGDSLQQSIQAPVPDSMVEVKKVEGGVIDSAPALSPASQLVIRACDNYLAVNPDNQRVIDVFQIKASLFYNNNLFDSARSVYAVIAKKYNGTSYAFDAIRMIAQSYYEQKEYTLSGEWYKKLSEESNDSTDKSEAQARIAESVFRLAEVNESKGQFVVAAQEFERVALEYPESKIADVALFNAGLNCEKISEWSRAILLFERLIQKYSTSHLNVKSHFRIGKCYEKLQQWDLAASAYLRIPAEFPSDEFAQTALYNAGFCFENGEKYREAAAIFEKMVLVYPASGDAADVLFRAGELYGKVKDWEAVARVSSVFTQRFGNDENRIVQALCMTGVAHYMRNRTAEALRELNNAVSTYRKIRKPGQINAYYAAKALFTIGEIRQAAMASIALGSQDRAYRKRLAAKADELDACIKAYGAVIRFKLSEWTTRAVYQIGQAYEDFALGIYSQERPSSMSLEKRMALELGIAKAVDKYFIEKALAFHERNVKLGIAEKIEDRFILQSRQKLTYLPYLAAENYLAIVEISRGAQAAKTLSGFALIARKLEMFQKIAPFQKRAIELYLKCLEMGIAYQEQNEYYESASASITGLSLEVGKTYAEVVGIAREAPIPKGFDKYEMFVYKTKLLRQVEEYENQALESYLKTIKIADAYKLTDSSVVHARHRIGELLFNRGRCYDLLCTNAFNYPPYPQGIDEAEKEVYKVRFEEIGLRFQEQAFDIYKNILGFAEKSYAAGPYVTHAYIRLYQNYPEKYGVKTETVVQTAISTGSQWKVSADSAANWVTVAFEDSAWAKAARAPIPTDTISGFPGNVPIPMWGQKKQDGSPDDSGHQVYFRRTFFMEKLPATAQIYLAAQGKVSVYLNAEQLIADTVLQYSSAVMQIGLMGTLRTGRNIIGIKVDPQNIAGYGVYPLLLFSTGMEVPVPQPPGFDEPLPMEKSAEDVYKFPVIKNFSVEE